MAQRRVERSTSSTLTACFSSSSRRRIQVPKNPQPPVTRTFAMPPPNRMTLACAAHALPRRFTQNEEGKRLNNCARLGYTLLPVKFQSHLFNSPIPWGESVYDVGSSAREE